MRTYTVRLPATSISTAITVIQIVAGTNQSIRLISGFLFQSTTTTNAQQRIQLLRKSVAATVTAQTPAPLDPSDTAAAATGGTNASAEGTDSTILLDEAFSLLTGWIWKPIPEEFVYAKGAGILAIKFPAAPAAQTFEGELTFQEIG